MRKLFTFIVLLFCCCHADAQCPQGQVSSQENLVINGDFSMGNQSFISDYTWTNRAKIVTYNQNPYRGSVMMPEAHYSVVNNPNDIHDNFSTCKDRSGNGNMMVVNGSYKMGAVVWQQKIQVEPSKTYLFSCWLSSAHPASPAQLKFSINGTLIGNPILASSYACGWKQFYTSWESGDLTEITISIVNQNIAVGGNDFILDDITFYECLSSNFEQEVQTAKVGEVIELREVFFDSGKSELKAESFEQLEKLVDFLRQYPLLEIEIAGHTDNLGLDEYNLELSINRAKAVANYLRYKEISEYRFRAVGFGDDQPIDSNDTFEGRQLNRRVEFKILKI